MPFQITFLKRSYSLYKSMFKSFSLDTIMLTCKNGNGDLQVNTTFIKMQNIAVDENNVFKVYIYCVSTSTVQNPNMFKLKS